MKKLIIPAITILLGFCCQNSFSQETVQTELQKARELAMQGQKEQASAILVNIMASNPDNKAAVQYWLMANMKRSPTGEIDAVKQLDSLGTIYPNNTGIIFFKNFILAEYGKNDEALAGFDKLIQMQPDTAVNYIAKGQVLSSMGRNQEAFTAFEKATTLAPTRFDVWGMKASVLARLNRFDEALVAINKGIDLSPDYAGNIYNRACIYCLKGDKANALADLKNSVEKMPELKQHARTDEDFKNLWDDEDFKKITQ